MMDINKFNLIDFAAVALSALVYGIAHKVLGNTIAGYAIVGILYLLAEYLITEKVNRRKPIIIRAVAYTVWCSFGPVLTLTAVAFIWDFIVMMFRRDGGITW